MRLRSFLVCAALAGGAMLYTPEAQACGGCFPPQGEQASIVTDHRMVMTVSAQQSTLYDQIRYQGSPSEFAWLLPIRGEVEVGLSADSLFTGLDTLTSLVVQEPPRNCPQISPDCYGDDDEDALGAPTSASAGGSDSADAGVSIIKQEVVGPYATVQLKGGAAAVYTWLTDNHYNITDDLKPIIQDYAANDFAFLALRLRPGAGVQTMRPIRVTAPFGGNVSLPLKMVAAGTGATVGITLWVVSNGRYETTNFESFVIRNEEITWDWTTGSSNYRDLRAQKNAAAAGKVWEVESSTTVFGGQLQNAASRGAIGPNGEGDYIEEKAEDGTVRKTAAEVRAEDFEVLQRGLDNGSLRITRLRADLSRAALANDLSIGAAADQSDVPRTRQPKLEKGQPLCPVINGCTVTGEQVPRDQAWARSNLTPPPGRGKNGGTSSGANGGGNESDGTFTCRTTPAPAGASAAVAFGLFALFAGSAVRSRRRSR